MPVLVKYLFTSQALSIQVHPSDKQARDRGLSAGKEECWYILDAEPGAVLGIGTIRPLSPGTLRDAALSGAIERLMQWHPVGPGMFFHIPPGTVHAIGPGISLVEIQQNSDVTYRIYDYGRPRELHLADGMAVADARPFPASQRQLVDDARSALLLETPNFAVMQIIDGDLSPLEGRSGPVLVIPLQGQVNVDDVTVKPGECLLSDQIDKFDASTASRVLVAQTGEDAGLVPD
jgi:mannose-6-phosphate isomerase